MKVLIAPDSFKNSLSAFSVGNAIKIGMKTIFKDWEYTVTPMSDGGEGMLEALQFLDGFEERKCLAKDAFGKVINSTYLRKEGKAYFELAATSGLHKIGVHKHQVMHTSTVGLGLQMKHAIENGINELFVFLGGSATNDAGLGALFSFADTQKVFTGNDLANISFETIEMLEKYVPKSVKLTIAADVSNTFYGKNGAAFVYARQKGATNADIELLDFGLEKFSNYVYKLNKKELQKINGAGAAGGTAGGLFAFFDSKICSGFDILADLSKIEEKIKCADLIITAEGKIDSQTNYGKLPNRILELARKHNKKAVAFGGAIPMNDKHGFDCLVSIQHAPILLAQSMKNAENMLMNAAKRFARTLKMGMEI